MKALHPKESSITHLLRPTHGKPTPTSLFCAFGPNPNSFASQRRKFEPTPGDRIGTTPVDFAVTAGDHLPTFELQVAAPQLLELGRCELGSRSLVGVRNFFGWIVRHGSKLEMHDDACQLFAQVTKNSWKSDSGGNWRARRQDIILSFRCNNM